MVRSRFAPPSNDPESDTDILLVYTQFTGDIGAGLIIHIEPAGEFANTRATAHAEEFLESTKWGNVRLLHWLEGTGTPQTGKFVLFDELYAAPIWNARQLVDKLDEEIERETKRLEQSTSNQEIDR